ncbi:uncharacterized protein LOC125179357 [Hyalella azteca]|uniref:Uncharacterized protein LOC125179357 n=1 Tax=Hyalella azteca TaxID=294128 RepID=A0A979FWS4_HYAAZ|nr:uncharacterized protein LOC125179357 [Hyalella azteca]
MSYFRRPNPKSNWTRPKPKIYDCNARDLEKFYQDSYSEYLSTKSDRQARDLDRERRGDAEQLSRRFEQRRASSLVYGEDDTPRTHRFIPNRQTSNDGTNEHSFLRSRLESSLEDGSGLSSRAADSRSSTSATRHVSFSSTLNAPDANAEMASIETRLERLRKLREDLGLPAEAPGSSSYSNSTSLSRSSENESSGRENSRWTSSVSARSNSCSRGSPTQTSSTTYSSTRTEKSSNHRNGTEDMASGYKPRSSKTTEESSFKGSSRSSRNASSGLGDQASSYSSKSSYSAGGDTNGYKDSYESSYSTRKNRGVEKPSLEGIDLGFDDDALLLDVKKKFPSSSEILERIKNMDID